MSSVQYTRVVADENVPQEVVDLLNRMGFKEVYSIADRKAGVPDTEVWRIATEKQAVLITGDVGFLPQLTENQVLYGPDVLEYSTRGFSKSELQDARVMSFFVEWLFSNDYHHGHEHVKLLVDGAVRTRRQLWGHEKRRRKR